MVLKPKLVFAIRIVSLRVRGSLNFVRIFGKGVTVELMSWKGASSCGQFLGVRYDAIEDLKKRRDCDESIMGLSNALYVAG